MKIKSAAGKFYGMAALAGGHKPLADLFLPHTHGTSDHWRLGDTTRKTHMPLVDLGFPR